MPKSRTQLLPSICIASSVFNNTDKADICEYVSHSLRHSLQRMKLHHSRMLQDLSRKQEALSLEHRSMNTRGRLTTTSSANKSLVPLAPLTNSGGKSNLQLLAEWILTAECFGLHCTKLIFGFLCMEKCHQKYPLLYTPVCAELCFRLYCDYYHWLHLRL